LAPGIEEELGITAEAADDPFAQKQGQDSRMDIWTIHQWTAKPSNCSPVERDALA
jgi:hypothetical protein